MKVIAIDPGPMKSAMVFYDSESKQVIDYTLEDNETVRKYLHWDELMGLTAEDGSYPPLLVEYTPPYAMQTKTGHSYVPNQVVLTAVETGRFIECYDGPHELVSRLDVKKQLLGRTTGNDANITQAILDRYGGSRLTAVGLKKSPGPLYGLKKDLWQALAVAIAYTEQADW